MNPAATRRIRLPLLFLLLAASSSLLAQTNTNLVGKLDYSNFKIIPDRNIFNPHRRGGVIDSRRREPRASRVESFGLVGIMSYEKGPFAFFDGTSSEYRKVLRRGDSIAGYRITNLEPNLARLTSPTNELELHVGMQVRRQSNGGWSVAAAPEISLPAGTQVKPGGRPGSLATSNAGAGIGDTPIDAEALNTDTVTNAGEATIEPGTTNAEPAAAADSSETDPVLRRLIERRNQELNR